MTPKRKRSLSASTSRRKLRAATGATTETAVERALRWWHRGFRKSSFSAIYAVFLLVPAALLTWTFFPAFKVATVEQGFWASEECWFFALGAVMWTLAFFGGMWATGTPWPLHLYVFGHELTHAVWVWLSWGKVYEKKWWSADGGYIVTDSSGARHTYQDACAPPSGTPV